MKNGNFGVEREVVEALIKLGTAQARSDYERHVWLTSGYIRLASVLHDKDPQKAKEYLNKAKSIIDKDSRLNLMLEKWEKLAKSFVVVGVALISSSLLNR